jgi:DUF1680 family protein
MNWDTPDHVQYERASAAMSILDRAGIPYAFALGNHDTAAVKVGGSAAPGNVNANLRITTNYNHYFPLSRFRVLQSVYEEGKIDNACHAFHAGGLDWLVINLELWARTNAVEWAEAMLKRHPHHNAILLTHSHLNANGGIEPTKGGYGDNSPQYVFDRLRQHPNLRFIFSGHTGKQAHRTDLGTHGNVIHQFLQCYHDNESNPVRLIEIDVEQKTITSRVYCPATDETKADGSSLTFTNLSWVPALPTVSDRLHFLPPGRIVIRGDWAQPITNCLEHRVLSQDVNALVQPFRARVDKTEWRSEFWGKWITSAELAGRWNTDPRLRPLIERAVTNLLATQSADGYLGAYASENHLWNWDIWGRKYTLLGLLGWQELSGDPAPLQAAQKLANHLLTEVGPQRLEVDMFLHDMWGGMACSSVIEPMVLLYRRTGDTRYLDFAQWVVREWERPGGPDILRKALRGEPVFNMFPGPKPVIKDYMDAGHSKAYEMMSCFEGLLELHRVTGRPEFRDAAIRVFKNIADTEITAIGSGSDWERWCDGARRQTEPWQKGIETCVTVTWIKFAAQLQRLTGEAPYGDFIETAAFNALFGSLNTNGDWFCHHAPLAGVKEKAPEQCQMHQNCCVASGPRGLMLLPILALMQDDEGPAINLYGSLEATTILPSSNRVKITQTTDYPIGDTVRISLVPAKPETFPIKLRIPAWSTTTKIKINGKSQTSPTPGQWLTLRRPWRAGDVITVRFDMAARVIQAPENPRYASITRGPLVLARDARLGGDVNAAVRLRTDRSGRVPLKVLPTPFPGQIWSCWRAPLKNGKSITLCDFASAGNTWSDASQYRVWLLQADP